MIGDEVEARLARPPRRLGVGFDDVLVDLGRDDVDLRVADDVFGARAPGDSAGNPALAGLERNGGAEAGDEAAVEGLDAPARLSLFLISETVPRNSMT